RVHSLDRDAAVVILTAPQREQEVRHALEVAPFLEGDIACVLTTDTAGLARALGEGVRSSRARRDAAAQREKHRETPPPLSARYLGTLLDSAPIGIVTVDADGAVIGWNRRAGDMFGVAEVEALGTPFAGLWPEDERLRLEALIAALDAKGLGSTGETFEREGSAFELTGARFTIRSGESGAILVMQDVTQRVAAERELQLQKALLEAQSESAVSAIAVVSLDGTLQTINRRWLEIWNVDEQTIREDRERATELMLAQVAYPDAFMAGVDTLASDLGGEYHDDVRLKDGRTIERYGAYVRGPGGEVIGRVWFHTDITERKRDEDALRFLAEATEVLSSSLDYEVTLRRVAELAVPRIADWCAVEVASDGGRRQIAVAHSDPDKLEMARQFRERYPDDASAAVPTVIRTGEAQIYPEIPAGALEEAAQDDEHLRILRELQLQSVMIVPIQTRDRIFGAITLVSAESGHTYDDDDLQLALELARRAAIHIDNARVHADLRQTARALQESLLPPHLPAIDGVELAARFRPAGTGLEVGGDFYDIFPTARSQWGLVIGDVCGKGAEAAAITALTRYTLRTAAMYERTAAGVLAVLNEALLRQRNDFRFTTLAFCLLDLGSRKRSLRVAAGGHPLPLVLRADGTVESAGRRGPLLGVLADADFGEGAVELRDGDAILLYTDGVTDAHAPARMVREDDLMAELERCAGRSAAEIAAHIEDFALAESDQQARDDIALVVARLEGV
ncbi:MAG: SpoIIE family protein phosphatase, partial [Thermoleophilaceae bacterium]